MLQSICSCRAVRHPRDCGTSGAFRKEAGSGCLLPEKRHPGVSSYFVKEIASGHGNCYTTFVLLTHSEIAPNGFSGEISPLSDIVGGSQ